MYYPEDDELHKLPITITTESSEHSRITSFSCLDEVVSHVEQKLATRVKKVYVSSDGCSSQFRSRFIFCLFSNFQQSKELEFFQLSFDIQPFYSQFYRKTDDPAVCWHTSADDIDENTYGYCSGKYGDNEQEWMECPSCKKWYHEKCFSL